MSAAPPVACPAVATEQDNMFCLLDEVQADIARDALQHFAILSGKEGKGKGRIIRASKALQRLLNYDLDTPFPQDLSVFFGPKTDKGAAAAIADCIKTNQPYQGEVLCYKHTGQTIMCDISLRAVPVNCSAADEGAVCIACFMRNVDELQGTEHQRMVGDSMFAELVEDHAEQSRICRQALDTTLIVEPDKSAGCFVICGEEGPGVQEIMGYSKGELSGVSMEDLYGPGTTESDRRLLARAMQDHEPLSCDILCYNKGNSPWWRHMLAIPVACDAFLTFNVDVTRSQRYIGDYLLGYDVGRGSFGTVKLGRSKTTGQIVAIKRINEVNDARTRKLVDLEIEIQGRLKSPHIAELYDTMKVENMVFMVMEFCSGGSLFDKLVAKGGVDEFRARGLFQQIVQSVDDCHKAGVVHRDLKPENLLLDEALKKITLIDFGLATYFVSGQKLTEVCGSKRFQAPEVMRRATSRKAPGYEGPPVDVWSMAVILFELVHGQIRLSQSDSNSTAEFIEKHCASASQRSSWSDSLTDLLRSMLVIDPAKRITIPKILAHPWLTDASASPSRGKPKNMSLMRARQMATGGGGSGQMFRSGTDGDNIQGTSTWSAACGDDGEKPKAARLRQKLGKGGAKLTGGAKLGGGAARAH
jgi:PAS domain-containing protein